MNKELNRKPWEYFNITEPLYNDIVAPYKEIAFQMAKEATGKFLLMDVNLLPNIKESEDFDIDKFLELAKEQKITLVSTKPSLGEAIEVLCNALKERNVSEENGLKPQMLTTKKLEILKTIANSMRIDWDEVVQDDKIISLELKLFKPINK